MSPLPRIDALVQAGLQRAEQGLSDLLGRSVGIDVDMMSLEPVLGLTRLARNEALVTGIYVAFQGDLSGHALLYLPPSNAERLASRLLGEAPPADMVDSALLEVGNITVSGLVNGIADCGGWRIHVSPPVLARDMLATLVNSILVEALQSSDSLLAVRGRFGTRGESLDGMVLLMPDAASLGALLDMETQVNARR